MKLFRSGRVISLRRMSSARGESPRKCKNQSTSHWQKLPVTLEITVCECSNICTWNDFIWY